MDEVNRRSFLSRSVQAAAAAAAVPYALQARTATAVDSSGPAAQFCAFTESFQSWPVPKVCEQFASIGLDGLDLTVRPGGHIAPEEAGEKLPAAADAAKKNGIRILMLTSAINNVDKNAEVILGKCGELGITRVKLGYFPYTQFGNLKGQVDEARKRIEQVAKLAHKHDVLPCVHIHSGPILPASGVVAYMLLKDFKPGEVGAYVDPMHMTVEGGLDGWRQGLDLLKPWISLTSMKNCFWASEGRDAHGQMRWDIRKCPLSEGVARIPDFIALLRQIGYRGIYSLHSEYQGSGSWKSLNTEECLSQTKADFDYVKTILSKLPA